MLKEQFCIPISNAHVNYVPTLPLYRRESSYLIAQWPLKVREKVPHLLRSGYKN